jgi:integrase/recombinase XerD
MEQLDKVVTDFIFHCRFEKTLSPLTLKAYQLDLNQFLNFVSTQRTAIEVQQIDKHLLREYLQVIQGSIKDKSVKRKIATLKALFNYLEFEDRIVVNPFRKMRIKIREQLNLPRILTLEEITTLLKTVYHLKNGCSRLNTYQYQTLMRDIAVMELLFATGIRVSELCGLKVENVSFEQQYIRVLGKGNRERIIKLATICKS